jgi:single-strand DNA-binding protein
MNKTIFIGRTTKDLELKKTTSGTSVVSFSLAVNRDYKGDDGEIKSDSFNIVAWQEKAENLVKYVKKGHRVALDCRAETRQYDDKDGTTRTVVEFVVNSFEFLEPKKQEDEFNDATKKNFGKDSVHGQTRVTPEDSELPF